MIVSVGDIAIELQDFDRDSLPGFLEPYLVCDGPTVATCGLEHHPSVDPSPKCIFDPGQTWRVEEGPAGIRLCVLAGLAQRAPYQTLDLNQDLTEGKAYLDRTLLEDESDSFALRQPLHELWTSFMLMRGRGILVHGLGVLRDGRVQVFAGKSGVGKSTLGGVFAGAGVGEILSDDRLVVRPEGNGFRVYGTPWHGEARFQSASSGTLEAIHFLKQGPHPVVAPVSVGAAAARLLASCFIAGWPRSTGLQFALDFCTDVVQNTQNDELQFTPDEFTLETLGYI